MEIKLSIKSQALTDKQREAIQGKLQEIEDIIKGEKENRQRLIKTFVPHHSLQSENGTLPQSDLHDELSNGKRLLIEKEPPLRVQFHGSEKQRATIHSIFQRTQAESNLLEMTLDQMFRSERHRSQQCGMSQVSELERFLLQVDNFQKQVKLQIFPLFENIHCNKI